MEALVVEKTPSLPTKKMKNPKRNGLRPLYPLDDLHGYHHIYPQLAAMKQGILLMPGGDHTRSHGGAFSPRNNYPPKTHPPLLPLPVVVSKPAFLSPPPHSLSKSKQQKGKRIPSLKKSDDVVKEKGRPSMKQRVPSDPGNDPKNATRVDVMAMDKFSGSSASSRSPPPPSSLPMPTFSLIRQPQSSQPNKLSSAAEVDDGATDNLCRLLRLR